MSGMAEVLAAHRISPDFICECGADFFPEDRMPELDSDPDAFIAAHESHRAAALTAAGFGPVREAKAPELRYVELTDGETELDEVVAQNAYVHLEAMSENHWWLLVTSGDQSVHVNFYTKRAKISGHAEVEEDAIPRAAAVRGEG